VKANAVDPKLGKSERALWSPRHQVEIRMLFTENLFVYGKAPGMELYQKNGCARFFLNFMRLVDWRSTTRRLSQIWLQVREKSKSFFKPCYVHTRDLQGPVV